MMLSTICTVNRFFLPQTLLTTCEKLATQLSDIACILANLFM